LFPALEMGTPDFDNIVHLFIIANSSCMAMLYTNSMRTIILPGFSVTNKEWAEEIKNNLDLTFPTSVYYWKHWESGKTEAQWVENEANRIISDTQKEVNVIAKSIGTAVAMVILKLKPELINKIILCGVPIYDLREEDSKYYDVLVNFPTDKILCIQNIDDTHGSYEEVEKFLHSFNPNLKIISKPRSDHEYPYSEDFINFLKI